MMLQWCKKTHGKTYSFNEESCFCGGAQREYVLALQFLASGLEAFLVWEGVKGDSLRRDMVWDGFDGSTVKFHKNDSVLA